MISAIELAKYIVSKCSSEGCPISNLQLQKILFFIQKDRLRKNSWFIEDDFEAWQYGPVIKDVYDMFSYYAGIKISGKYSYKLPQNIIKDIDSLVLDLCKLEPWELTEKIRENNEFLDIITEEGENNIIPKYLIAGRGKMK